MNRTGISFLDWSKTTFNSRNSWTRRPPSWFGRVTLPWPFGCGASIPPARSWPKIKSGLIRGAGPSVQVRDKRPFLFIVSIPGGGRLLGGHFRLLFCHEIFVRLFHVITLRGEIGLDFDLIFFE